MIRRKKVVKPKNCFFCKEGKKPEYKDIPTLEKFLTERGKILARSKTGICSKHQKKLMREVKRARFLALLPYVPSLK